jgi:hypothetical protein
MIAPRMITPIMIPAIAPPPNGSSCIVGGGVDTEGVTVDIDGVLTVVVIVDDITVVDGPGSIINVGILMVTDD